MTDQGIQGHSHPSAYMPVYIAAFGPGQTPVWPRMGIPSKMVQGIWEGVPEVSWVFPQHVEDAAGNVTDTLAALRDNLAGQSAVLALGPSRRYYYGPSRGHYSTYNPATMIWLAPDGSEARRENAGHFVRTTQDFALAQQGSTFDPLTGTWYILIPADTRA